MRIKSLCNTCFQAYDLTMFSEDLDLVQQIADESFHTAPCPRLCGGRINLVGNPIINEMQRPGLKAPLSITSRELYQAVMKAGLPDEVPKDPEVVSALLMSNTIASVDVEMNDGRCYINHIELKSGTKIHFAAGLHGAVVLKMTKKMEAVDVGTVDHR